MCVCNPCFDFLFRTCHVTAVHSYFDCLSLSLSLPRASCAALYSQPRAQDGQLAEAAVHFRVPLHISMTITAACLPLAGLLLQPQKDLQGFEPSAAHLTHLNKSHHQVSSGRPPGTRTAILLPLSSI